MIHRDVKPANVQVTADGQLKIIDFGIAIPAAEAAKHKRPRGTISYLAPEVIAGEAPSFATDLFGAGLVAYEVFAGCHPFGESGLSRILDSILCQPVDLQRMKTSPGVRAVVGRLLAKDPACRFADADTAAAAFQHAAG